MSDDIIYAIEHRQPRLAIAGQPPLPVLRPSLSCLLCPSLSVSSFPPCDCIMMGLSCFFLLPHGRIAGSSRILNIIIERSKSKLNTKRRNFTVLEIYRYKDKIGVRFGSSFFIRSERGDLNCCRGLKVLKARGWE